MNACEKMQRLHMRTVFPWSMSDFKPGEKCVQSDGISEPFLSCAGDVCRYSGRGFPNEPLSVERTVLIRLLLVFTDPESR